MAALFGTREVPGNSGAASGTATLTMTDDRLQYAVSVTGLSSPPVLAQLHIGGAGQVGPVVVPFELVGTTGVIASGVARLGKDVTYNTLTISRDSLRALMTLGLTYVNVFTATYPGGEVRGQVVPKE